jgi:hypothetical protein
MAVAARQIPIQLIHRNANFIGSLRLKFRPAIVCRTRAGVKVRPIFSPRRSDAMLLGDEQGMD